MTKITKLILKIPLFFLRWINAAIMRIPASYAFSLVLFLLLNSVILNNTYGLDGELLIVHLYISFALSIVWGLIYTIFKLPVNKKIYKSNFHKILAVLGRIAYAVYILDAALGAKSDFINLLCLYVSCELVVNAIVVAIKGKTTKQIVARAQKAMGETNPPTAPTQTSYEKTVPQAPVVTEKNERQKELDANFNFLVDNFVKGKGMIKFVDGHQQILKNKAGEEFIVPNFIVNEQAAFIVDRLDLLGVQVKQQKDGTYLASHKGKVYTFNKIMAVRNAVTQFIKNEFCEDFDVVYILCLSDDRAVIKVNKDSELPVLRLSDFGPFIENYRSSRPMSEELKNRVADLVVEPKDDDECEEREAE